MEDTRILKGLLHWLFPCGRITAKIVLLWLFVVAVFAGYGFLNSGNQLRRDSFSTALAIEGAILMGSLGVGVATCIAAGLMILANVQANRITKFAGVLHLVTSSFVSTIATPVTVLLLGPLFPQVSDLLRGEGFMGIASVSSWAGIVAITSFILLTITVILSRQQPKDNGSDTPTRDIQQQL